MKVNNRICQRKLLWKIVPETQRGYLRNLGEVESKHLKLGFHSGFLLVDISFICNYWDHCFCLHEARLLFPGEYNNNITFFLCVCVFADSLTTLMKTTFTQRLPLSPVQLAIFSSFTRKPQISSLLWRSSGISPNVPSNHYPTKLP